MSLDPSKLKNYRPGNGRCTFQCPACAAKGEDTKGDHLVVYPEGNFCCIKHSNSDHSREIIKLAGVGSESTSPCPAPLVPSPVFPVNPVYSPPPQPSSPVIPVYPVNSSPVWPNLPPPMLRVLQLPAMRPLEMNEEFAIASVRNWPGYCRGPGLLAHRGLLWYAMVNDGDQLCPAWVIVDSARRNAQARRIDGQPWAAIGSKAKSIQGSEASWPIGASDIGAREFVVLCEGQPDFCAALLVAWLEAPQIREFNVEMVAPVCMTGARLNIHLESLGYFAEKHVRIAIHHDNAGWEAFYRWGRQLRNAGARSVDGINFEDLTLPSGVQGKDLADYATTLSLETSRPLRLLADLPAWLVPTITSNAAPLENPVPYDYPTGTAS